MVISLTLLCRVAENACLFSTLRLKYPGCFGSTRTMVLLLSIVTTSNMVGRSAAFSCTHSSAMFMHLITSAESRKGTNDASMSSLHLPSLYNCHACLQFHHQNYLCRVPNKQNNFASYMCVSLTYPRRLMKFPHSELPEFLFPPRISRTRTPKLNTSDLTENRPSHAYSGAMYPLK